MSEIAYFIGGEFDLTKRILDKEYPTVAMLEPINKKYIPLMTGETATTIPCRQLIYITCVTRQNKEF